MKKMSDDLIYRQAAIDAASCECNELRGVFGRIEERLKALPSAEEESFEWCYTCKEYDQEKHCCHRWTKVIRNTVEELQSAQPEIVRCKDCKHWVNHKRLNIPWCKQMHIDRGAEDFCSDAERRTDDQQTSD